MKLAIISDTHNLLRPQVLDQLTNVDAIIHGGDIGKQSVLDELSAYAPVYAVRGNNDTAWAETIPHDLKLSLGGLVFYVIHKKCDIPNDLAQVDVVIYGHSHKYLQENKNGVVWLNPGSCGPRRFHQEITMAIMEIGGGMIHIEKIVIPHDITN